MRSPRKMGKGKQISRGERELRRNVSNKKKKK